MTQTALDVSSKCQFYSCALISLMEHKKEMSVHNKPSAEKLLTQAYVKLFCNWHIKTVALQRSSRHISINLVLWLRAQNVCQSLDNNTGKKSDKCIKVYQKESLEHVSWNFSRSTLAVDIHVQKCLQVISPSQWLSNSTHPPKQHKANHPLSQRLHQSILKVHLFVVQLRY